MILLCQNNLLKDSTLQRGIDTEENVSALFNLSTRLSHMNRLEEALDAIQDVVMLHRQQVADQPAAFNADLAMSLNNLSNCLSDLGHLEDALDAIQEVVKLHRQLAADRP